ncbi:Type IV fimbrial biogenesis protein PilX [Nitrincola lacisaponensis]|uniref:Type IV fimbrial biogenesis protein PilX n=1 Tax=Nitrincola lacisaponensis TaxID=267850 RepID=A0A063Y1Z3_9GAMM|nr:PilX N-terminal domain-containing pilus assembly protein [Nitrincola lacisaponensis]KDE39704.1 Type IV fimbrial biogenesis protein PilX [Nitrincola lacisaponensis]
MMSLYKQAGSALIVSLLFLLILTILGVAGIQTTSMQERMSGNMRDRNMAFQAAEAALRGGEDFVRANSDNEALFANSLTDPEDWDGEAGTTHALSNMLHQDPRYFVSEPGLYRVNPGELPAEFHNIFPVNAIGWGGTDVTTVVVESRFRPVQ